MFYMLTTLLLNGWFMDCEMEERICRATYFEKGKAFQTLYCTDNEGCLCFDSQAVFECGKVDIKDKDAVLRRAEECCK